MEYTGVDEEIVLKRILRNMRICVFGLIQGPVAGSYECGSKPIASIKRRISLD